MTEIRYKSHMIVIMTKANSFATVSREKTDGDSEDLMLIEINNMFDELLKDTTHMAGMFLYVHKTLIRHWTPPMFN